MLAPRCTLSQATRAFNILCFGARPNIFVVKRKPEKSLVKSTLDPRHSTWLNQHLWLKILSWCLDTQRHVNKEIQSESQSGHSKISSMLRTESPTRNAGAEDPTVECLGTGEAHEERVKLPLQQAAEASSRTPRFPGGAMK